MRRSLLALGLATSAFLLMAQAQELLRQAYEELDNEDYKAARRTARSYLSRYPPTYKAKFIIAASNCRLRRGDPEAIDEMAALKEDYPLTPRARANVNEWLSRWCLPDQPREAEGDCTTGECSTYQALTEKPSAEAISSATSSEPSPRPLPRMSALQYSVSYSGDDYAHYGNIASPQACAQICRRQAPCRSMTYITSSKVCWLKRSRPAARAGSDYTSAYKILN